MALKNSSRKSKRAKACDIPESVKRICWERDNHRCIICGSPLANPSCHIVSRAKNGLGIETNVVTLCNAFGNNHHFKYDSGTAEERAYLGNLIDEYMRRHYGETWCREDQIYKKYKEG